MPNYEADRSPYVFVDITYARGQMNAWSFRVSFRQDHDSALTDRIALAVNGGFTEIYIRQINQSFPTTPNIRIKGFGRAMRLLSQHYGIKVAVGSTASWTCAQRGLDLFGTYGEFVPPPPPVVATVHPVTLLREAHAEYAARIRGEETRTRLGYCMRPDCNNVAAGIALVDDVHQAVCKAHEPFDPDMMNNLIALVRRNGRVFAAEVKSFGYKPSAFARAASDGHLVFVKDGGMSRWEPAPTVALPGGAAITAMFTTRNGKRKANSRNRRYRKGA
jgi:hypothetical protein